MKRTLVALSALLSTAFLASAAPSDTVSTIEGHDMHSYILLDRTGSMSAIWDEALSSVNSYAETVAKPEEGGAAGELKTSISLAVFDHHNGMQFKVLRRSADADAWAPVSSSEASPRGMTPLFDAIGRMVSLAEEDNPERAVIVIMTDGHENASREFTRDTARAALDRAREKGWEVVFLGADFGQFDDAEGVGVAANRRMGMSHGSMQASMSRLAGKARAYGIANEDITFDDEDRNVAGEDKLDPD